MTPSTRRVSSTAASTAPGCSTTGITCIDSEEVLFEQRSATKETLATSGTQEIDQIDQDINKDFDRFE